MNSGDTAERMLSILIRLFVSALLPVWAIVTIVLAVQYRSFWWLACGVGIGAAGLLMLAGSPIIGVFTRER
ncbi:MAG TPA: hypothetical protein VEC38_15700 [Candidatus Binataceae bacterium]|nr:hypothetical protein [Candidatus Binataceae bacterium]